MNNSRSQAYGCLPKMKGYQMEVFTGQDYCFNLFYPMIEIETAASSRKFLYERLPFVKPRLEF